MAILLTNGKFYIAHSDTGAIIKVQDAEQAQNFYSIERAIRQRDKHPKKCAGYYFIDTDMVDIMGAKVTGTIENLQMMLKKPTYKKKKKSKHKQFGREIRRSIYEKTQGHCYLCGEFVEFDSFEVEHKIPLSKGGSNELNNLFCSCHCCNSIKQDIYPQDFMEKISQIFMYQMQMQYGNSLRWKLVNRELSRMM